MAGCAWPKNGDWTSISVHDLIGLVFFDFWESCMLYRIFIYMAPPLPSINYIQLKSATPLD